MPAKVAFVEPTASRSAKGARLTIAGVHEKDNRQREIRFPRKIRDCLRTASFSARKSFFSRVVMHRFHASGCVADANFLAPFSANHITTTHINSGFGPKTIRPVHVSPICNTTFYRLFVRGTRSCSAVFWEAAGFFIPARLFRSASIMSAAGFLGGGGVCVAAIG